MPPTPSTYNGMIYNTSKWGISLLTILARVVIAYLKIHKLVVDLCEHILTKRDNLKGFV